jgi:hypothetical protein
VKPLNVVAHEHYHAMDEEDVFGRYDACLREDGTAVVWSPETDRSWEQPDYETAKKVAEQMAKSYKEYGEHIHRPTQDIPTQA